jgi:hypothetical protein
VRTRSSTLYEALAALMVLMAAALVVTHITTLDTLALPLWAQIPCGVVDGFGSRMRPCACPVTPSPVQTAKSRSTAATSPRASRDSASDCAISPIALLPDEASVLRVFASCSAGALCA